LVDDNFELEIGLIRSMGENQGDSRKCIWCLYV